MLEGSLTGKSGLGIGSLIGIECNVALSIGILMIPTLTLTFSKASFVSFFASIIS
jgi:hypothetical protein